MYISTERIYAFFFFFPSRIKTKGQTCTRRRGYVVLINAKDTHTFKWRCRAKLLHNKSVIFNAQVKRLRGSLFNVYCCLPGLSVLNCQQKNKIMSRCTDFIFQSASVQLQWLSVHWKQQQQSQIYIVGRKGLKLFFHRTVWWEIRR